MRLKGSRMGTTLADVLEKLEALKFEASYWFDIIDKDKGELIEKIRQLEEYLNGCDSKQGEQ